MSDTVTRGIRVQVASFYDADRSSPGPQPGPETTNTIFMHRTLIARSAIKTVELALEVAGGASYHRRNGLERLCAEEGTALLVTSHNMIEVERLCERVVFVSGGHVVADGKPAEVAAAFGRDDLEAVFLHLAERAAEQAAEERL